MNVETRLPEMNLGAGEALQLSHIHMNVETGVVPATPEYQGMLQLSHIHMNVETAVLSTLQNLAASASIEPHSYECGNRRSVHPHCGSNMLLQLSHIHMNVETH